MSGMAFRFVHAGDFRLQEMISGMTEIPDRLRETLVDAPYQAAQRVVDTAIQEQAQFLILSGDLLNPLEAPARALSFLLQQFQRLAEHDISVYWAGGRSDPPDRWPDGATLPDNVTYFSRNKLEEVVHYAGDRHVATILGRSAGGRGRVELSDFAREAGDGVTIAVYNGDVSAEQLAGTPVQYWALGGRMARRTLIEQPRRIVHYSGAPQGRSPKDHDAHGCALVEVDTQGQLQARHLPTDVVRFRTERVFLPDHAHRHEIVRALRERSRAIAGECGDRTVLVTWEVDTGWQAASALCHGPLAEELIRELWENVAPAGVWTIAIQPMVDGELPSHWYDEDTILGDYLRAIRAYREGAQPLDLHEFVGQAELDGDLHDLLQVTDGQERDRLLREAALLGAVMLRGDS